MNGIAEINLDDFLEDVVSSTDLIKHFLISKDSTLNRKLYSLYAFDYHENYYLEETDFVDDDFNDYSCEDIFIVRELLGEGDYLKSIPNYNFILRCGELAFILKRYELAINQQDIKLILRLCEHAYFLFGYLVSTNSIENKIITENLAIKIRSNFGKSGAAAKLANDDRQKALADIRQEYESQKTQFKRRGYTAQFVREMASKYTVISSQKTIENLVAKLNKENEHIPR